ncbi:MAG: CheY-like chemotaxis protein [Oleiphilaceae bacterium]|jgi:CheY-like chemotaxis protein
MSELQRQIQLAKYYRNLRFLVVDDFENFRLSIRQMIRTFGVENIEVVSNGEDAVSRCEFEEFDVILCDYNLGSGKNGQQVLEELRHNKLLKQTSIFILITAETSKDMVMGALEYLPDGYITKPITKAVLQKRLDGMIEQREILKPINEAVDIENFDLAIKLVNREIQSETKYVTWCLRKLSSLYYLKGEFELARKIYEDVLSKRDIGWANLGLGKVNIALGRYEEAILGLSSLIKQNGNMIEAYDWLAEAQVKKGKAKDAQATLKSAVAISPLAILRQTKLAEVCTKNKDVESAAEAFRQSVKLGFNSVHESPDNYLNLGKCLSDLSEGDTSELGKKRAKEAVHTLGRAAKKFKDNPDVKTSALLIESRVHKGQGDDNKSKTALEKAQQTMDMARASADTALEFAKTLYSVGEESQAEQLLSDLAGKHGDNQEILNEIEELLDEPVSLQNKVKARALNKKGIGAFETGDLAEAIKVFEDALLVTPKHPALNLNIVQVMLKQIKDQGGNPELKRKCDACLKNVQHIPSQHRQHKRYVHLSKKVDNL